MLVVILDVHREGEPELFGVGEARGLARLFPGARERWHQDCRYDRYYRYDNEQFYESEACSAVHCISFFEGVPTVGDAQEAERPGFTHS
jgi:hypothetical protein